MYYVVEAVPDTKKKTVFIVSAYMSKNKEADTMQSVRATNGLTFTSENAIAVDSASKDMVSHDNDIVKQNLSTVNQSEETKAALDAYKAQTDATSKAMKAVCEAEREQIVQSYKRKLKSMEASYSAEVESIESAFRSLVTKYQGMQDNAAASDQMVAELTAVLNEEMQAHDIDKDLWQQEFNRLLKEYDKADRNIERMDKVIEAQKQRAKDKVESHKKIEARQKIQTTINTLNKLLLNPTRDSHVPQEMQDSVRLALQAINGAMMTSKSAENAKRLQGYYADLTVLSRDPVKNADKIRAVNDKIDRQTKTNDNMKEALGRLRDAYKSLESRQENLYDPVIDNLLSDVYERIGDNALEGNAPASHR